MTAEQTTGVDVIGDIHGHADALEHLLGKLGYRETGGVWRHPSRTVMFLGDLIDRGPRQLDTLRIARNMVEAGTARIVMGNHEFNAVAYATRRDDGEWARPHTDKNRRQHAAFLAAVGEGSSAHRDWVDWFRSIPMWADLGGVHVVHACWHPDSMTALGDGRLTDEIVTAAKDSALYDAAEVVLKGPEISIEPFSYDDKDGNIRHMARMRWWDPTASTLKEAALPAGELRGPDGEPVDSLPSTPAHNPILAGIDLDTPVLYGHYWRTGVPRIENARAACLDWSIAKGGQLVAYRFSREPELDSSHLVAVR